MKWGCIIIFGFYPSLFLLTKMFHNGFCRKSIVKFAKTISSFIRSVWSCSFYVNTIILRVKFRSFAGCEPTFFNGCQSCTLHWVNWSTARVFLCFLLSYQFKLHLAIYNLFTREHSKTIFLLQAFSFKTTTIFIFSSINHFTMHFNQNKKVKIRHSIFN